MRNEQNAHAFMKKFSYILAIILLTTLHTSAQTDREYYQIRIYHLKTDAQLATVETYLEKALLPAFHEAGVKNVGVFKPALIDTAEQRIYILIPYRSINDIAATDEKIQKILQSSSSAQAYRDATFENPPYQRMEVILLKAFKLHPKLTTPSLNGPRAERIYELRSYEGHTEKISQNKIHMFNEGGEIPLFDRLGFNAIFYGEVIAGSKMPNLMYMTSFDNRQERDQHWQTFGADPEWKKLSSMAMYQKNVSHIDIHLLRPTSYSDF